MKQQAVDLFSKLNCVSKRFQCLDVRSAASQTAGAHTQRSAGGRKQKLQMDRALWRQY